jgi:peptide deformylase
LAVRQILLLGDPDLSKVSEPVALTSPATYAGTDSEPDPGTYAVTHTETYAAADVEANESRVPRFLKNLESLETLFTDLKDTLEHYRAAHGEGIAISAPQIRVRKRVVCLETRPGIATVLINPEIAPLGRGMVETWENCMSFPNLLVRVRRHKYCSLAYCDQSGRRVTTAIWGGLSVVLQHECDHLDGILAIDKALDVRSNAAHAAKHGRIRP